MTSTWTVERDGHVLHDDSAEHVARVVRTLRIEEAIWRQTLAGYRAGWSPGCAGLAARLALLARAYAAASPHAAPLPVAMAPIACPICLDGPVRPAVARRVEGAAPPMVYGRCARCGHGALLAGAAPAAVYQRPEYFTVQDAGGVGYADYEQDRVYREAKGRLLFESLEAVVGRPRRVLEIGSGYGFTRAAARDRGAVSFGVDLNRHAAAGARRLYGMDTFVGPLAAGLATAAVAPRCWEVVLYQFVLEHIADPVAELRHAATALAPGGYLVLTVPNMDAVEVGVFGASYRSFRTDHLHVFSRGSLAHLLAAAGYRLVASQTDCTAHLLQGFVSPAELAAIYQRGEGPDWLVIAESVEGRVLSAPA